MWFYEYANEPRLVECHWLSEWRRVICILIEPHTLNEARVSSYIQDILRHEDIIFKEKTFKYVILVIKDAF